MLSPFTLDAMRFCGLFMEPIPPGGEKKDVRSSFVAYLGTDPSNFGLGRGGGGYYYIQFVRYYNGIRRLGGVLSLTPCVPRYDSLPQRDDLTRMKRLFLLF